MQILDLNQVLYSSIMIGHGKLEMTNDLLRHMIINVIRYNKRKFENEYGKLVLAMDNKKYWRREQFPNYKFNRKKVRDQTGLDWKILFQFMNEIRQELKEYFPYKVMDIDGAEADDVIAVLSKNYCDKEKILILSGDKDFCQLHIHSNDIDQFDPVRKKWIKVIDPKLYLKEHIIRGDAGDGIPNILSDGDTFLIPGKRQNRISSKYVDEFDINNIDDTSTFYKRNQVLIDFEYIPKELQFKILEEYQNMKPASAQNLLQYFMKYNMKNLASNLSDF